MMCFDYHRICRGAGSNLETILTKSLLPEVVDFKSAHGFYLCSNGSPEKQQTGTIRTNCLDCLDRTNSVQAFLGRMVRSVGVAFPHPSFPVPPPFFPVPPPSPHGRKIFLALTSDLSRWLLSCWVAWALVLSSRSSHASNSNSPQLGSGMETV